MALTITEKYDELSKRLGNRERLFIDKGVPNPQGGYFREPMTDPDEDYEIPQLRVYYVPVRGERQRLEDLASQGWHMFTPEPEPAGVKSTKTRKK